ncbi:21367_t:CDS:2 [Gigaspora margarita]|uniref:21367_t:CDS:1 n=1 Tax=Gigaspora margarita TaxID=4874 RepID=A0ABN7V6H4_GIGMA|nr:21367_t:CDS:2 [Gigaspora margarita]
MYKIEIIQEKLALSKKSRSVDMTFCNYRVRRAVEDSYNGKLAPIIQESSDLIIIIIHSFKQSTISEELTQLMKLEDLVY